MKKIFIRSKGDQKNGWGNVIRQFTIAKYLSRKPIYFSLNTNLLNFVAKILKASLSLKEFSDLNEIKILI